MKTESLHIGMNVKHPQYGAGVVKGITEHSAEIAFETGRRTVAPETSGLETASAQATLTSLDMPLHTLISEAVSKLVDRLGLGSNEETVPELGARWHGGKLVLHPADPTLQTKEVPLEVFFHKIVMMRNNFRVMEQKINGNDKLTDGEKVDLQQYISRCYGSMTSFNLLFRNKEDQFGGA
jgi:hypothetical protein